MFSLKKHCFIRINDNNLFLDNLLFFKMAYLFTKVLRLAKNTNSAK